MSEFQEAAAAVAALSARLAALQAASERRSDAYDEAAVAEAEAALEFVSGALGGELDASMSRFRARSAMVDPVTQAPRFGPKMMAKVQEMLTGYEAVQQAVEEGDLLARVAARIEQARGEQRERERQAEEQRARVELEHLEAAEAERARQEQEEQERRRRAQQAEQERVAALAKAAQLKREQRAKEREAEQQREREEQERRAALNNSVKPGKESLERAVAQLRESCGNESVYRNAVEKLLVVVANVVASPDNPALRQIPRDNVNFHADIGQFDGGHQSLLAMGFRELQQDDKVLFVLEEPDLSEDLDKWSEWFDNLKEFHDLIVSKLDQAKM